MSKVRGILVVVTTLSVGVLMSSYRALAVEQPHMEAARTHLEQAQKELEVAERDKGGHRVKALRYIGGALKEVKLGIEYGNAHPNEPPRKKSDADHDHD